MYACMYVHVYVFRIENVKNIFCILTTPLTSAKQEQMVQQDWFN